MQVTVEIPEEFAPDSGESAEAVGRKLLEQYAIAGYSAGRWGHFGVQTLLGFETWQDTEQFLRANKVPLPYDVEDLKQDLKTYRELFGE